MFGESLWYINRDITISVISTNLVPPRTFPSLDLSPWQRIVKYNFKINSPACFLPLIFLCLKMYTKLNFQSEMNNSKQCRVRFVLQSVANLFGQQKKSKRLIRRENDKTDSHWFFFVFLIALTWDLYARFARRTVIRLYRNKQKHCQIRSNNQLSEEKRIYATEFSWQLELFINIKSFN